MNLEKVARGLLDGRSMQVRKLIDAGHTEEWIISFLGLSRHDWDIIIGNDPEFAEALERWKLKADERVEASLYERATGYSHPDTHISAYQGEVIETPTIKHYPPDTQAAMFWLKNRRPDRWSDKVDVAVRGQVEHKHLHLVSEVDLQDRINALLGDGDAVNVLS